jgi:hypothetical protein
LLRAIVIFVFVALLLLFLSSRFGWIGEAELGVVAAVAVVVAAIDWRRRASG